MLPVDVIIHRGEFGDDNIPEEQDVIYTVVAGYLTPQHAYAFIRISGSG